MGYLPPGGVIGGAGRWDGGDDSHRALFHLPTADALLKYSQKEYTNGKKSTGRNTTKAHH